LYPDTKALAADSSLIVIGAIASQQVAADITPDLDFTLSTMTVERVLKGYKGLAPGAQIIVRQVGSETQPPPAPLLSIGSSYLLYLTRSGLPGDLGQQFYVTGGNAGLYSAGGASVSRRAAADLFQQMAPEPGEHLPTEITSDQATSG
jgi:hypothetical protein